MFTPLKHRTRYCFLSLNVEQIQFKTTAFGRGMQVDINRNLYLANWRKSNTFITKFSLLKESNWN